MKGMEASAYRVHMLDSLMTFLTDNETLVNNVMTSSQSSPLLESLCAFMANDMKRMLKEQRVTAFFEAETDYEYISAAMSGATIQTIKQWWANGHKSKDRKKVVGANALMFSLKS